MSKPPLLIGLTGAAGAGKDTVASWLEHEWAFERMAFAEPLLLMLHQLFAYAGVDGAWAVERALKEKPTTLGYSYRHLVQTLGTEWGREQIAPDFWVRVAAQRIDSTPLLAASHIVFSDVRFPNEAAWIKSRGGYLARVWRQIDHLPAVRPHQSEQHADELETDTELLNLGSIASLQLQVDRMVEAMLKHAA